MASSTTLNSVSDELIEAIKDVRKDDTSTNFVIGGFPSDDSWDLILLGSGSGGVEAMKEFITEKDICYGLVRKTYNYDTDGVTKTNVEKFIFITWRTDDLPLKRKRKIGLYDGQIKKLFSSYHADLEISSKDEVSEQILEDLIARITMKASRDTDRAASSFLIGGRAVNAETSASAAKSAVRKADTQATSFAGNAGGYNVDFDDIDLLTETVKDVRNDATPTTWCLFKYKDKKTITFSGKGEGAVPDELLAACPDGTPAYGLFRVIEQYDKTQSVRFCFMTWQPDDVPVMMRAVISTHKGSVQPKFRPYSHDFFVSNREDLTLELVMDHISGLSGMKSHATDRKPEVKEEKYERKFLGGVKAESQPLDIENEDDLRAAIKAVRSDDDPTNWCTASFDGKNRNVKLVFGSKGSGGVDELRAALNDDSKISFGLVRLTHQIDSTNAVKFLFISWQGSKVPPTMKAKTTPLRSAVLNVFHPYHADMYVGDITDLSDDAVQERIGGFDKSR